MSGTQRKIALTIAGSDPSGGAGIQADLKTFHQLGVYGAAAITLLTVQNTRGVKRVEVMPPDLINEQVRAVLEDLRVDAIKLGALGNRDAMEAVKESLRDVAVPIVVDPVMISKHGAPLMEEHAIRSFVDEVLPFASLVTPNTHEAERLAKKPVRTLEEAREAALRIAELGPKAVLVKGGHLEGDPIDVLLYEGQIFEFALARIETTRTHGTGCTLSSAITALLAGGVSMPAACEQAKTWLSGALRSAPQIGSGVGPVDHFAPFQVSSRS